MHLQGHPEKAHEAGCMFVGNLARVPLVAADIVITSNGGYPLDQNIYQAVKGMTAAEACVRKGGVIIIAASCVDGHSGEAFYKWFLNSSSPCEVIEKIANISRQKTTADQWEAQILARVLEKCSVIMVAEESARQIIEDMHMLYAIELDEALEAAERIVGSNSDITVIPDGVSVIVK